MSHYLLQLFFACTVLYTSTTCEKVGGLAETVCESDPCMIEESLLDTLNNDPSLTWKASNHTPFWGHKLKEGLKLRLGTLNPQQSMYGMFPLQVLYDPHSLPPSFKALETWSNLAPVQDQGWCGSSWAISTAAVASDMFVIISKGKETPLLSTQHLLDCNVHRQLACNGGYLDRAWQFTRKFGLVNEECLPYMGVEHKCRLPAKGSLEASGCLPPRDGSGRKDRYHVSPPHRLGNETDIMRGIMHSGPVQATMRVYQDFFSYSGGIYRHQKWSGAQESGYHSVRLLGWGSEDGIKFWLAANSWGTEWGENGYFRIVRGVNECEIESFVIGVWASPVREGGRLQLRRRRL